MRLRPLGLPMNPPPPLVAPPSPLRRRPLVCQPVLARTPFPLPTAPGPLPHQPHHKWVCFAPLGEAGLFHTILHHTHYQSDRKVELGGTTILSELRIKAPYSRLRLYHLGFSILVGLSSTSGAESLPSRFLPQQVQTRWGSESFPTEILRPISKES